MVKTNKPCRFTISFELSTLFQKLVQKVVEKETSNKKVYYIIPLNYRLAGHPENFKIKLFYSREFQNQTMLFSRKIKSSI